jgi:hypothetical protein
MKVFILSSVISDHDYRDIFSIDQTFICEDNNLTLPLLEKHYKEYVKTCKENIRNNFLDKSKKEAKQLRCEDYAKILSFKDYLLSIPSIKQINFEEEREYL